MNEDKKMQKKEKNIYLPLSEKWVDGVNGEKEIINEILELHKKMIEYRQLSVYHRDIAHNLREQIKLHEKYIAGEYLNLV